MVRAPPLASIVGGRLTKRFRRGLVVGKFAPLHNGHVLVIQAAIDSCDHVVLLSYSNPEFKVCASDLREEWLAESFPDCTRIVVTEPRLRTWFAELTAPTMPPNDADADDHREFVAVLLDRLVDRPIDAVFTSEAYGPGFAQYLTRRARSRDPDAAAVAHAMVDPSRQAVPVSGSALRLDLWQEWRHLPAPVARSLVRRVVLLGGESSGKSSLAAAMATALDTLRVAEYGRELWTAKGGALQYDDLASIAREQIAREELALRQARRWLFCDTSPLTTLFYCVELFDRADPELVAAAARLYDEVILCAPDFPFVQDGTRQDPAFRNRQHAWYVREFETRGIDYRLATGSLMHRVDSLTAYLRCVERRASP